MITLRTVASRTHSAGIQDDGRLAVGTLLRVRFESLTWPHRNHVGQMGDVGSRDTRAVSVVNDEVPSVVRQ